LSLPTAIVPYTFYVIHRIFIPYGKQEKRGMMTEISEKIRRLAKKTSKSFVCFEKSRIFAPHLEKCSFE